MLYTIYFVGATWHYDIYGGKVKFWGQVKNFKLCQATFGSYYINERPSFSIDLITMAKVTSVKKISARKLLALQKAQDKLDNLKKAIDDENSRM